MATTSRFSWLVVGGAFGLGCASALSPYSSYTSWFSGVPTLVVPAPTAEEAAEANVPGRSLEAIIVASPPVDSEAANKADMRNARPLTAERKVRSGDTLMDMLLDSGVPMAEADRIIALLRPVYDPKKLDVGKSLTINLAKDNSEDGSPTVNNIILPLSLTSTIEVTRTENDNFTVKQIDIPVERKLAHSGGKIDSSLYQTAIDSGIPPALIGEIINAYSYDVDFQREIKDGDAIDVLFERVQTKDGQNVGHGNVVFAELVLNDKPMKIYRYIDKSGTADYYNEKGESVRKALLRTPINGAKITSRFGMRSHPILGYTRMHRGVDFGAPTGTPIYAAGDASVEFVGKKSGYGNYMRLKHTNQYSSAYAHISRFAAGMAPGRKVKQGQIIAYVGSTGLASGPHLHYEIYANNEQVNPANVKFKTGNVLQGKEMLAFRQTMQKVEAKLAAMPRGKMDVAMNYDKSGNLEN